MPFPRRLLNDDEEVVLDLRPHWWSFAGPVATLVATLSAAVAVRTRVSPPGDALLVPILVLALVALVWFVRRYARWATTNFVVTTDRLIFRCGVLSRHGREIPIERVNDISVHQTLFDRLLGAGDLMVESAAEGGQQVFSRFPRPGRVQNAIHRQIDLARARSADPVAGRRDPSPLEQLEKLEELRQRGVVSRAEFEAKKAQLLDRL